MQQILINRIASGALLSAAMLTSGCASVAVTDDAIQRNTAVALGVGSTSLEISDRMDEGVKTTYVAKANGKTYNCYVTGTVSVVGRVVSDAMCTELKRASPGKATQTSKPPSCNALLRAAGKC